MITVLIRWAVKPNHLDTFLHKTQTHLVDRAMAAGARRIDLYQNKVEPTRLTLIEVFDDQAAIDTFYDSAEYRTWHESVRDWIDDWESGDQNIQFTDDPRMPIRHDTA